MSEDQKHLTVVAASLEKAGLFISELSGVIVTIAHAPQLYKDSEVKADAFLIMPEGLKAKDVLEMIRIAEEEKKPVILQSEIYADAFNLLRGEKLDHSNIRILSSRSEAKTCAGILREALSLPPQNPDEKPGALVSGATFFQCYYTGLVH